MIIVIMIASSIFILSQNMTTPFTSFDSIKDGSPSAGADSQGVLHLRTLIRSLLSKADATMIARLSVKLSHVYLTD